MGSQIRVRSYRKADQSGVIALWQNAGLARPQNDPGKDIARKLLVNPDWLLVAEAEAKIIGTAMVGYDGHRGWLNYVAVAPDSRRTGVGRALLARAEEILSAAGCAKINLQVREGNVDAMEFYRALGFSVDPCISMGKRLVVDE